MIIKFTINVLQFAYARIKIISGMLSVRLMSDIQKDLEILALRSQLAICQEQITNGKTRKPRVNPAFRFLWVALSKYFRNWKSALVIVKPETVIGWHKHCFKLYWRFKSRKRGRPKISRQTIALIKRINKENPLLSSEKIYDCDKKGLLLAFIYT